MNQTFICVVYTDYIHAYVYNMSLHLCSTCKHVTNLRFYDSKVKVLQSEPGRVDRVVPSFVNLLFAWPGKLSTFC